MADIKQGCRVLEQSNLQPWARLLGSTRSRRARVLGDLRPHGGQSFGGWQERVCLWSPLINELKPAQRT